MVDSTSPRRLVAWVGLTLVVATVAVIFVIGAKAPAMLGTIAGGPGVEWNRPFLAWPQTGDRRCETEDGPCHAVDRTPDPSSLAFAKALHIAELAVPVGAPGRHRLDIGTLILPDGLHTRTFFRIVNGDPAVYRVYGTRVEFRSLVQGAPPFTEFAADRPPVQGPEPVVAVLTWDVAWAADGAVMQLADIEVE